MQEEGVFEVDANTSIDQLSEDLKVKIPEVSYFIYTQLSIYLWIMLQDL